MRIRSSGIPLMKVSVRSILAMCLSSAVLLLVASPVYSTQIAVSPSDFSTQIQLFDDTGASIDSFSFSKQVQDIEYDQSTGDLYALLWAGAPTLARRTPDGNITTLTGPGFVNLNAGADLAFAVSDGIIAVSVSDFTNQVNLYDLAGVSLGSFGLPGAAQDIEFDPVTGDLYALLGGVPSIVKRAADGTVTTLGGPFVNFGGGGDIAFAVNDGIIAVSPDDFNLQVNLFDTAGNSQGTALFGASVQDIDFDPVTGDLYAFLGGIDPSIYVRAPDGTIASLGAGPFTNLGAGGDIGVYSPGGEPIPEPSTLVLIGTCLVGLFGFRRKFKN